MLEIQRFRMVATEHQWPRKQACASTTAPKEQIYISPATPFGRVMALNFAPWPKRAFISWPMLFGAGCSAGDSRGCSRTQMA